MSEPVPTMKEIFEVKMPENLTPEKAKKINAIYQFKITGEGGGEWFIDLTKESDWVSAGTTDKAKCTITVPAKEWVDILLGKLNPQMAFMSGKLKVQGDMGLAMKLQSLLKK
ncbi:MAG: SCP2 sterol-binding domain-containing protein [Myxococcota bacterium]